MSASGLLRKIKTGKICIKIKKNFRNIFLDLWLPAANQFQGLAVLQ